MDYGVYDVKELSDEKLVELISNKQSFIVNGFKNKYRKHVVETVIGIFKEHGLEYRLLRRNRILAPIAAIGAAVLVVPPAAPGITLGLIAGAAIGTGAMGTHQIATRKADYEIMKSFRQISVTYLKTS